MPLSTPHALYDVAPLRPLVQAGYVLLTPNLRLARRIKSEWDQAEAATGAKVWQPAPVQTLELWLQERWEEAVIEGHIPPLVPLSSGQMMELWHQCIREEAASESGFSLLQPRAAASLAYQTGENLLRWQVDLSAYAIRQAFELEPDCAAFLLWHRRLTQKLAVAGQGSLADALTALCACSKLRAEHRVALLEFDDVPPLFSSCLARLCIEVQHAPRSAAVARTMAVAYPDRRAELQAVAHWVGGLSRSEPHARVGVVLADMQEDRGAFEYLLRREFDCLGEHYASLPVNFSTGLALDKVPLVRDALRLLQFTQPTVPLANVVALLQSRFVPLADRDSVAAVKLVQRLYESGTRELVTASLRNAASRVSDGDREGVALGDRLQAVARRRGLAKLALPSQWVAELNAMLDIWGWPGSGPLDSLEFQQLEQWYRVLEEFAGYDGVTGKLPLAEALQLLSRCCCEHISQPKTADSAVQVLGPLEAAGLRFDYLWLCGMQASQWPAAARPSPFIPLELQRQRQMPHASAEREWTYSAALMAQYRRAAPLLHASYAQQIDGVPELASALLADFTWQQAEPIAPLPAAWLEQSHASTTQWCEDSLAPAVGDEELAEVAGGAGLLEDQSQCPFRALAKRRLRIAPLGDPVTGLSAAERGALLHEALYLLWGELKDSATLLALPAQHSADAIENAASGALASLSEARRRTVGSGYCALERQRLATVLSEWLEVERQRSEFRVAALEQEINLGLDRLQIKLRVDRIDELPDGESVIIDYKSGTSQVSDWLGERPARPQLLLYGIAAATPVAALSFAQVKTRDCKFVGLGQHAAAPGIEADLGRALKNLPAITDWQQLNAYWRVQLERLAQEFLAGAAAVDPLTPSSCTWCGLRPLCRVDNPAYQNTGEAE